MTAVGPAATRAEGPTIGARVRVAGKFLFAGDEKLYVRGVTYGTFAPASDGAQFPSPRRVASDFAQMAEAGVNAVRVYTVPPRWLLDLASEHGLRVMVGLPWEEHVAFLSDRAACRRIRQQVRDGVAACAGHPAVLCFVIGNEIPAPIVRWQGKKRVERFLRLLHKEAKVVDSDALVAYVNYPTTEYLDVSFSDLVCFNVYLEVPEQFDAYVARLQSLAGERPLLLTELGFDSSRNGVQAQAEALDWQVRHAFAGGCAGAFVFSWTDEWHRGGHEVKDWDFGVVDRDRAPKPALRALSAAFADVPFPANLDWPRISVVVCSYNGERIIRDCMEGLARLDYPDFEVIVVNDGSRDRTPQIAAEYGVRLISTENRGLSNARNTGMEAATGSIVAYTDDDARPDPHWLRYIAWTYMTTEHAAVGGPIIAPPGDGPIADCVANAPGGPVQVLLSDTVAEHIPGCNMTFRKECLQAIGGFDPRYRTAGDDVDACWRILDQGWTIGFHAGAMVWHHRRNSTKAFWKQQIGYGRAEALLEAKWPEKYNLAGHLRWHGRLYGKGLTLILGSRARIYHGSWGSAPFQSVYEPAASLFRSLPLMPEWYIVLAGLCALGLTGLAWSPLLFAWVLAAVALALPMAQAAKSARAASFTSHPRGVRRIELRALTALFHLMQPAARLKGRMKHGLTLWRRRGSRRLAWPVPSQQSHWSEDWRPGDSWLRTLDRRLRSMGAVPFHGGSFDAWDLEVHGGLVGGARLLSTVEEHGSGKQMLRFRVWPRFSPVALLVTAGLAGLAAAAAADQAVVAALLLGGAGSVLLAEQILSAGMACGALRRAVAELKEQVS